MLHTMLLGTLEGIFAPSVPSARLVGLHGNMITHLAVSTNGVVAAAVPRQGPVHLMYKSHGAAQVNQDSGLHILRPITTPGNSDQGAAYTAECVWAGDARACGVWDLAGSSSGGGGRGDQAAVALAVGTEPADVFCSMDGGNSWSAGSGSFAAVPSRKQWSFPAPPHEPHVLSIERLPAGADGADDDDDAAQAQQQQRQLRVVAGIEVGGVLVSTDASFSKWEERSEGLYTDVHSCRIDPHDPCHWLAVTGRGLYSTHNAGASWQAQVPATWAKRYTVGLAFSPQRQGEVMVAAGDRPPAIGVHVYRSTDGGGTWRDITEDIFQGECAEARGTRTPVPYFCDGQALLGTDTGHLLAAADAERRQWHTVCRLPHPIVCMAAPGQSPSSVMH